MRNLIIAGVLGALVFYVCASNPFIGKIFGGLTAGFISAISWRLLEGDLE